MLTSDRAAAEVWYRHRLAESFGSSVSSAKEKIDLCFIDGGHALQNVVADVKFFRTRCRFLLFHDIIDTDSQGVKKLWVWLKTWLLLERAQRIKTSSPPPVSDLTSWDVEEGYLVKECIQQAGTRRKNFGLGLISAQRLNSSWVKGPPPSRLRLSS